MKESPILFSGEMVQAILDGRKTMTRRVVKPQPYESRGSWLWEPPHRCCVKNDIVCDMADNSGGDGDPLTWCRFQVGDRLWVRETWRPWWDEDPPAGTGLYCVVQYRSDMAIAKPGDIPGTPDIPDEETGHRFAAACDMAPVETWRPSIFMPRWASRLLLEVTDVRVQRVQDISEEDAKAEGVLPVHSNMGDTASCIGGFYFIWGEINEKRGYGWDVNPWVWAVSFKVLP